LSSAPLDRSEFERWRAEADRALRHAELAAQDRVHNWACFSAEQAAQLAVKALLHGLGRGPWGHDLAALGERLSEAGLALSEDARAALLRLSRHYVATRYPDAHAGGSPGERYSASDADQALADARAILAIVDQAWDELDR
jgi:HEPN domain-containing protein